MKARGWLLTIGLSSVLWACGDGGAKTGSETHWLSCETTADCQSGYVCSAGRCLPEDEQGTNNGSGQNNGSTSGGNNGTTDGNNQSGTNNGAVGTNNATTGTNNQTTDDACPITPPVPPPVEAVHEVTFEITNDSAADVWIPTRGWFCDTWEIAGMERNVGFRCGCECPNPGAPYVEQYQRVSPGETLTQTWDGRRLVPYQECVDCSDWGTPAVYETNGVMQPIEGGAVTFRIPFEVSLPPSCGDNGDGTASCVGDGDFGGELPGEVQYLCPSSGAAASATFDVPAADAAPQTILVPVSIL